MASYIIEIIDDRRVRLYDDSSWQLLSDEELKAHLQQLKNVSAVVVDPLHTAAKLFSRQVKDKRILDQVIVAEMDDYLLHDSQQYHFARAEHKGKTWVSWIEKSRLQDIKQRFAALEKYLQALLPMPLLLERLLPHDGSDGVFAGVDFVYAVLANETLTLPKEQAQAWLASRTQTPDEEHILLTPSLNLERLNAQMINALPNLWTTAKPAATNLPLSGWAFAVVAVMAMWCINSYWDYRHAKQHDQAVFDAQLKVLRQIFPQAKGADPYGRMRAEFSRSSAYNILQRLSTATDKTVQNFSALSIDMAAHQIVIQAHIDDDSLAALQQQGFSVSRQEQQTQLSWADKP